MLVTIHRCYVAGVEDKGGALVQFENFILDLLAESLI
jgi:hypothetical protein